MSAARLLFASGRALFRVAGVVLRSAPALITANHLYAAPFGAQLQSDLDATGIAPDSGVGSE